MKTSILCPQCLGAQGGSDKTHGYYYLLNYAQFYHPGTVMERLAMAAHLLPMSEVLCNSHNFEVKTSSRNEEQNILLLWPSKLQ